jgi:hypothetical protein
MVIDEQFKAYVIFIQAFGEVGRAYYAHSFESWIIGQASA